MDNGKWIWWLRSLKVKVYLVLPIMLPLVKCFWGLKTQPNRLIHRSLRGSLFNAIFSKQRETFPPINSFGSAESLVQKSLRDH